MIHVPLGLSLFTLQSVYGLIITPLPCMIFPTFLQTGHILQRRHKSFFWFCKLHIDMHDSLHSSKREKKKGIRNIKLIITSFLIKWYI